MSKRIPQMEPSLPQRTLRVPSRSGDRSYSFARARRLNFIICIVAFFSFVICLFFFPLLVVFHLRFIFLISLCIFWSVKRAFAVGEDGVFLSLACLSVIWIIGALCPRGEEHRGSILGCTSTTFNIRDIFGICINQAIFSRSVQSIKIRRFSPFPTA
jgi:hypothetical protein